MLERINVKTRKSSAQVSVMDNLKKIFSVISARGEILTLSLGKLILIDYIERIKEKEESRMTPELSSDML